MRNTLATFLIVYFVIWTFWPAALGKSIGSNAGEFMREFSAAYRFKIGQP